MSRNLSAVRAGAVEEVATRLKAIGEMDYGALRREWRRLYRHHPPKRVSRDLLMLGVAWKLQERAYGGLSATMKRRLAELAKTLDDNGDLAKSRVVRLKPGAKLVREWRGETHDVLVLEDGFQWRGRRWQSLSAIAREITGAHWSGPRFFGLQTKAKVAEEVGFETGAEEARDA